MSGATGRATQLLLPRGGMIRSDRVKSFGDGRTPFSFLPASTRAPVFLTRAFLQTLRPVAES